MNGQSPYSLSKPVVDTLKKLVQLVNDPDQEMSVVLGSNKKFQPSVPPPSAFVTPDGHVSLKAFAGSKSAVGPNYGAPGSAMVPYGAAYGAPGSAMDPYGAAYGAPGSAMVPYGAPGSAMVPYGAPGSSMVSKTQNPQANAVSMPAFQTFASHYHEKLQDMDAQLKKHIPGYKPGVKNVDPSRLPDDFFQVKSDEDRFEDVSSLPKNVDEACKGRNKRYRDAYEKWMKTNKDSKLTFTQKHEWAKGYAEAADSSSDSDDSQPPVQKKAKIAAPPSKTKKECKKMLKAMTKFQNEFTPNSAETLDWAKNQGVVGARVKKLNQQALGHLATTVGIFGLVYYMSQNNLNPFEPHTKAVMKGFRKFKAEHGMPEDDDWDGDASFCTFPAA